MKTNADKSSMMYVFGILQDRMQYICILYISYILSIPDLYSFC